MDPSDDNPPGSMPPRPTTPGLRRNEERQGGFGSARWGAREPTSAPEQVENADRNVPFGGSGWSGSPGLTDLPEERPETKPTGRRRKPKGPTHVRRTLAALGASVDVVRDQASHVHIYAKSERDAYAALGFCMAEDRLEQMDFVRRLAVGRGAERLGVSLARHDAMVRTLGIPRRAQASASRLDGVARELLASFAGGVNAGRALVRAGAEEVDPWTLADSLAIELYLAWNLAVAPWARKVLAARALTCGDEDLARRLNAVPRQLPLRSDPRINLWGRIDGRILDLVASESSGASGGHVSALSGSRAGGAAALCACLELPGTDPSSMYPASLEFGGTKIVGVAHLGMPALFAGRNEDLAWGVVPSSLDDADCVVEELDGIGGFRVGKRWEKLRRRRETIRVRDGEDVRLEVAETRNGPLLSHLVEQLDGPLADVKPIGLALRWGPNSLGTALVGLRSLASAKSVREVDDAAVLLDKSPLALEVVAADRQGGVARSMGGAVPVRDSAAALPVRGWEGEADWSSLAPLSRAEQREVAAEFVYAVGSCVAGAVGSGVDCRSRRLEFLLASAADAASLVEIAGDTLDGAALNVLPFLREVLASPQGDSLTRSRQLLEQWDGSTAADSCGVSIYYAALFPRLLERLWSPQSSEVLAKIPNVALTAVLGRLADASGQGRFSAQIVEAFADAEAWLEARFGADPLGWSWGRVQTLASGAPWRDLSASSEQSGEGEVAPTPRTEAASGSLFTLLGNRFGGGPGFFEVRISPAVRVLADFSTPAVTVAGPGIDCVFSLGQRPPAERVELTPG